ncbi:coiled-coil domain-containing protein 172 isoform X1 [Dendropsophus ebraccatus]|uniref:coiled-coil domain-containing protein 172 isoform X1 n=1 Tax=Dendropsophus ebraccatus TaxID=150705 RepID=UPI0038318A95
MSVDSLYQQIVLTEQQAQERRRLFHEVKAEISKCHEKMIEVKERLHEAKRGRECKVTALLEKGLQRDLLRKRQEGLGVQEEELLRESHNLRSTLQKIKEEKTSEEEKFLKEIQDYNNNYGLMVNRRQLLREAAEAESPALDEEIGVLTHDIEALRGENIHLNALLLQRDVIQRELSEVQETLRALLPLTYISGLDKEISAAAGITKNLEAEKLTISQKPQSDGECLRLKKELESYREEKMESAYEALCAEIELLQQKLRDRTT